MGKSFKIPKFDGTRFEQHSIPIQVLPEIIHYIDLIKEIAKKLCLDNENRQRLPQGFFDNFRVNLEKISPGSAAPLLQRIDVKEDDYDFFDQAADELPIKLKEFSNGNSDIFDLKAQKILKKLGTTLKADEQLVFSDKNDQPYIYDNSARQKVIGVIEPAKSKKPIKIFGKFNGHKVEPKALHFKSDTGEDLNLPDNLFEDKIKKISLKSPPVKACIFGLGNFERGHIKDIDKVQHILLFDEDFQTWPDYVKRLKALAEFSEKDFFDGMKPGNWKENVLNFLDIYKTIDQNEEFPSPYICPNDDNGLCLEWEIGYWNLNVDISFDASQAVITAWKDAEESDESRERKVKLQAFKESLEEEFNNILKDFEIIGG